MGRVLTVNASSASIKENTDSPRGESPSMWSPSETAQEPLDSEDLAGAEPGIFPISTGNASSLGPCLYLGPSGERCFRPALETGFCGRHRLGKQVESSGRSRNKILAATIGIAGVLWPVLSDLIRELLRWIHSH